ncbi:MAG: PatB family C-S lyase [Immundisolibacterales bacterium]|nr:PatB family C-S lyase [Immundisolibacterales bacterium]
MSNAPDFNAITLEALRHRRGTKWNRYPADVLPAWVADMDFDMAEPIRAGLARMMHDNDLGYSPKLPESGLPEAFAAFAARRFPGWEVAPGRMIAIADIVQGIHLAIEAYTGPGDGICTLTPVYPPFLQAVAATGRRLDHCTMVRGDGRYEIDFDALRAAIDGRTRILLLCTPHNPLGRVFEPAELDELACIAVERDLVVIADEIHADIVYSGSRHIPFASLGPEVEARTVTMTSATKSFNIAGLRCAVVVFGSDRLAERFDAWPERIRGAVSSFGMEATRIAWTECDEWLEALLAHLEGNRDFLHSFVRERLPGLRMVQPAATYLGWIDCREYALDPDPYQWFLDRARVGFNDGRDFGDGGEGHVRINFATSRGILTQVLERMEEALR